MTARARKKHHRLNLALDVLAIFSAAYVLGWLASGGHLGHVDQIIWLVLALGWILVASVSDLREFLADRKKRGAAS